MSLTASSTFWRVTMKTDVVLKRDVQEELAWDPSIDAAYINVDVKNGVVTLTGRVNSYPEKQIAETVAKRVAGVQKVKDAIQVELPPGHSKFKDSEISQVVQTILKWNVSVADDKVLFSVKNGWLTLEGEVHWQYQKIALEKRIALCQGVDRDYQQYWHRPACQGCAGEDKD